LHERVIRNEAEFLAQSRQPCLQALHLDLCEADSVHSGSTRIRAGQSVGVAQKVLAANLVVDIDSRAGNSNGVAEDCSIPMRRRSR
jgi:hypothetical protein